jgi:hypothetical protein
VQKVALTPEPNFDPSKPLANVKHERFCWAVVQGYRLGPAYEIAGFEGKSPRLPWQLRHKPAIDARVNCLLGERIKVDTRARHRQDKRIADSKLRWRDQVTATPSHFLTADQAAQVRSITTKKGSVTFEVHDKLAALDKLARVLGIYHEPPTPAPAVMVNQVNVGGDNALEAVRRLAFAIAKAQNTQSRQAVPSHVIIASAKE